MTSSAPIDDLDYDIDEIREGWIGKVVASSAGRYPVEYDPIRRYCHMIGDLNPLFLDRAAAGSPYGEVIVPLPLVPFFAGKGPWPRDQGRERRSPGFTYGMPTPGDRGINLSIAWEYFIPVRVGDELRAETRVADVFIKSIRLDPAAVWLITETDIWNQKNELVARGTNTVLAHRAPHEIGAA